MSILGPLRRVAIAAFGALPLLAAVASQSAVAQSRPSMRNIQVDVAPLRANAGDPTASWVQQALPGELARALAGRMAAQGGPLVVRIDYVILGANKDGWAQDNISGVATIGGVERPVRAITRYQASAVDQVLFQESNHRRVTQLVQALAYWLARDF
jgi:predicted NBD/HSP70 family sugar kinase